MDLKAEEILKSNVVKVENFHISFWHRDHANNSKGWRADFELECGQRFHVSWNDIGYSFEPDPKKNNLPEVKEILWKRCRMGFGGRGCGLDTEVRLVPGSSEADKKAYQKILTPTEVDEGRWMPYPDYTYVPMLMTAFNIRYAWGQQQKIATIVAQADQNLKDALALRKATYDLRQYE